MIVPHGGPWARDTWGYDAFAQFLANRGYAVLQPNFRASTGYGKAFLNAGNNEWGQKMQDDITWGVKYLVSEGIVDKERVGIMGGSYGRLRHAGRAGVHAGRLRRGCFHRRPVEPDHVAGQHSALLGADPQDVPRAHGRPRDAGWQGPAGAPVAVELGGQDRHAAAGGAGRQRSARQAGRVGPRSSLRCASVTSRWST